jgi:hypothetical protein
MHQSNDFEVLNYCLNSRCKVIQTNDSVAATVANYRAGSGRRGLAGFNSPTLVRDNTNQCHPFGKNI